jgi:hypothetical protein
MGKNLYTFHLIKVDKSSIRIVTPISIVSHLMAYLMLYLYQDDIKIKYLCGFLFGISDGININLCHCLIIKHFKTDPSSIFAIYRSVQSLSTAIGILFTN